MANNPFKRASKSQSKLRLGLVGPSGSGKTFTALSIAAGLGERVAVIDTEHGSASKYGDLFTFDALELSDFSPQQYIDAIHAAGEAGYDVLVIDSLSHAWSGTGGALELVDRAAKRSDSKNTFAAWRDVTPLHNKMIEAMLMSPLHLIATMRAKTEYVLEKDDRGRATPRKIGMAPVQREGMEFEFDVAGDLTFEHTLLISKTRVPFLDGAIIDRPGAPLAASLKEWLESGEAPHWATVPAKQQAFKARMAALGLAGDVVLSQLEPGRTLARLGDTTLGEADALARLDELAKGE